MLLSYNRMLNTLEAYENHILPCHGVDYFNNVLTTRRRGKQATHPPGYYILTLSCLD